MMINILDGFQIVDIWNILQNIKYDTLIRVGMSKYLLVVRNLTNFALKYSQISYKN